MRVVEWLVGKFKSPEHEGLRWVNRAGLIVLIAQLEQENEVLRRENRGLINSITARPAQPNLDQSMDWPRDRGEYKPTGGIKSWRRAQRELEAKYSKKEASPSDRDEKYWRDKNAKTEEELKRMGVDVPSMPDVKSGEKAS